jgi:hypothetical protein
MLGFENVSAGVEKGVTVDRHTNSLMMASLKTLIVSGIVVKSARSETH